MMMTAPILRLSRPALAGAVALLLAGACGDDVQGPNDEGNDDGPSTELLRTLIVSNPVTSAAAAGASRALSGVSSSEEIVFVSLPPGSVSNGETAVIQTRGTEAQATAAMVDGGFDPIPVAAGAGDTLDIRIELTGGGAPLALYSVVPPSTPPVIVRTDPPPKRRDVPLNAVMLVVFSEPIDAATLTASSVQLLLDGAPVAGTLQFEDGLNLTATFTPAEPLAPGAEHTLRITQALKDLDGDTLEEPVSIEFTTQSSQTEFLPTVIVSNPVTSAAAAGASPALSGLSSSGAIVFVSLPPGGVPNGVEAVIQTRGTEAQATAALVDGGFDPYPLAAGAGDTLDIRIEFAGGGAPLVFYTVVPPSTPPVIVRTEPLPKEQGVSPYNAMMLVMFSEPIDAATLTASSVQLLLDGAPVAGTLRSPDAGLNLFATFTPAEPLTTPAGGGAKCVLRITQDIEDLDGDALAEELRVEFSTLGAWDY